MMKALTDIVAESSKCEEIWIHYSGHGSQVRDRDGNEADGMDEVVVPVDYTTAGFIVDDDIFNIIKNIKCRAMILRFVPQRNGVRPSVVVSVRRGVCLKNT
jgi:hypothetical protein